MISINNLVHRHSEQFSLQVDSLHIGKGSRVSIVGPSGSGKTTLIRLIAGLEMMKEGEVYLDGAVVAGRHYIPPHRRDISLLSQDFGLWSHLTVLQHVAFARTQGTSLKGTAADQELLQMVQLDHKAESLPGHLSGGERQRLALARALARRPKILLLDEPFSNLDPVLADSLLAILDGIHDTWGLTRVQVKHPHFGFRAAHERLIVMRDGRIVQDGSWDDLITRPADDWVRRLGEILA